MADRVGVDPSILQSAQDRARRIFEGIGVHLAWTEDVRQLPAPLVVTIADEETARTLKVKSVVALGVTNRSPEGGGRAFVFYDRVDRRASEHRVDVAQVLGAALAHEIGHLLLPHGTHGSSGLMRAEWDAPDFRLAGSGRPLFTLAEASVIRARLATEQLEGSGTSCLLNRPGPARPAPRRASAQSHCCASPLPASCGSRTGSRRPRASPRSARLRHAAQARRRRP